MGASMLQDGLARFALADGDDQGIACLLDDGAQVFSEFFLIEFDVASLYAGCLFFSNLALCGLIGRPFSGVRIRENDGIASGF